MIQELFGGASNNSFIEGERKISFNQQGALLPSPTSLFSSSSPSSTPIVTIASTTTTSVTTTTTLENQNLRCPRCDSSNTKFCYYNNYNLTQPRHFCKTCRRYWTKGGALRNVPIGGGCRKNRNSGISNSVAKASSSKMQKAVASELGRSTLGPLLDHELPPTPILWGSPQNTNFLTFLRANQSQNQNPNPSPSTPMSIVSVKEEGNLRSQSNMVTQSLLSNGVLNNPRSYDGVGQAPFWRNNNQDQIQQQNNNGFVLGGEQYHQTSGIQELYQKLRSTSSVNYCNDNNNSTMIQGNMASSLSNILESSSSVSGTDQFGCWNPTLSWSDLPTANGASYPSQ